MPFLRQLWTVDVGASVRRETAVVPPSASMILSATVCMGVDMRYSQTCRKRIFAIIEIAIVAKALLMRPWTRETSKMNCDGAA